MADGLPREGLGHPRQPFELIPDDGVHVHRRAVVVGLQQEGQSLVGQPPGAVVIENGHEVHVRVRAVLAHGPGAVENDLGRGQEILHCRGNS